MQKPSIGILAGMGPRSTALFIDLVIYECQRQYGAKYDMDFPKMVIYSLPTPFYPGKPIDHGDMKSTIMTGLKELACTGVDFIAMPCNTAHIYYEELRQSIGIPLLNIVEETIRTIPPEYSRIALLATRATMEAGIYQRGFGETGRTSLYRPEWQEKIDSLLAAIKQDSQNRQNIVEMAELLHSVMHAGAQCAVIGCTDLTPVAKGCGAQIEIIDSSACLAKATVVKYISLSRGAP